MHRIAVYSAKDLLSEYFFAFTAGSLRNLGDIVHAAGCKNYQVLCVFAECAQRVPFSDLELCVAPLALEKVYA